MPEFRAMGILTVGLAMEGAVIRSKGIIGMQERERDDRFVDLLLLRMNPPSDSKDRPYYTTGSILTAAMIRVAILGISAMVLGNYATATVTWWFAMISIWGVGIYPAWLQYQRFNDSIEQIEDGSLCGACRHFNPTNQLCSVLDEHVVRADSPPCEGEGWEPR